LTQKVKRHASDEFLNRKRTKHMSPTYRCSKCSTKTRSSKNWYSTFSGQKIWSTTRSL